MDYNYKGLNVEKDLQGQVEFNRRKNVNQDQRLASLESNVSQLITQGPSGFLPRVYYGLVRGPQTYRFVENYVLNIDDLDGVVGDAYGLISTAEVVSHINAVATQINENQIKIVIQGDYTVPVEDFNLVNQRTGTVKVVELGEVLSLQDASYLGSYSAQENQNKQITVLYDEEFNDVNVTFASVDYSGDGVYNWVKIGNFVNGVDGRNIYALTNNTAQAVFQVAKINDLVVAGEPITYNNLNLATGDLKLISSINPLTLEDKGNIRGADGSTGATGAKGSDGVNGLTPEIVEGYWHIGDVNTGVKALGVDGTDGEDGKAFAIQSGLYSVPANIGQAGNTDAEGNALLTLPILPQAGITGKGYIIYDPLTTPLQPYYDLYYANEGDTSWTIIHPFNGINGRNGSDGLTPYIQNNNWFIGNTNTGVPATGPQGPKGEKGVNPMGGWIANNEYHEDDLVTYEGSTYICIQAHSASSATPNNDANNWLLFVSKGDTGANGATGATGPTGATPSIAVAATALPAGSQPTATRSGTDENPIITFGIPGASGGGSDWVKCLDMKSIYYNTWIDLSSQGSAFTSSTGSPCFNYRYSNNINTMVDVLTSDTSFLDLFTNHKQYKIECDIDAFTVSQDFQLIATSETRGLGASFRVLEFVGSSAGNVFTLELFPKLSGFSILNFIFYTYKQDSAAAKLKFRNLRVYYKD